MDQLGRQDMSIDPYEIHEDFVDRLACYPDEDVQGREPLCEEDALDAENEAFLKMLQES